MGERAEVINKPWLNPEAIAAFIDELREAGYNIGVSQYIAAQDLIIVLIAKGEPLDPPERLGNFLGPLLCSTPAEQKDFKLRFNRWIGQIGHAIKETPETDQTAEALKDELKKIEKTRHWWKAAIVAAVIILVTLYIYDFYPSKPALPPSDFPEPNLPPTEVPNGNKTFLWYGLGVGTLLLIILFLFWKLWIYYRAHLFLVRRGVAHEPAIESIPVKNIAGSLWSNTLFLRIAQDFRRRIEVPSDALDINKTVEKTMQRGGWFTPAYGFRQVLPEYLVLVDRISYDDHQAGFVKEMIDRLKDNEVRVTVYYFNNDPRICFSADEKEPPLSFNEIAARHERLNFRLLLFTDASGFFNPQTGELEPWVDYLFRWQHVTVLTPEPPKFWGYREKELSRLFMMFPSTPDGLAAFIKAIHNSAYPYDSSERPFVPFPEELRTSSRRWIERNPPEQSIIDEMLTSLRLYLRKDGYFWLCACAVYPELKWPLTLYLGNSLSGIDGQRLIQTFPLIDLSRLPWFRCGYVPDWLRIQLILSLTREQEQLVRSTLESYLVSGGKGYDADFQFEIASKHRSALSALAAPAFRLLSRKEPEDRPLKDYVFKTFMSGRTHKLAVHLPSGLRHSKPVRKGKSATFGWNFWWKWVIANAVGFGLGTFISDILNLNTNLVTPAIVLSTANFSQWYILRRYIAIRFFLWIIITAFGNIVGTAIAFYSGTNIEWLQAFLWISIPGIGQWYILRRYISLKFFLWLSTIALASIVGFVPADFLYNNLRMYGLDIDMRRLIALNVFGALYGAVTGLVLGRFFGTSKSKKT